MRTIIDITDDQVKALDEISKIEGTSRTALIRQAIDRMLAEEVRVAESAGAAFGLWSYRQKKQKRREPVVVSRQQEEESLPPVTGYQQEEDSPVLVVESHTDEPLPSPQPPASSPSVQTTVDPLAAFFAGVKP